MKILLVEDEDKTAYYIKKGLEENTYEVDMAQDGSEGLSLGLTKSYDLIITDLLLPKLDGRELCRKLREANVNIPILILTALGSTDEKVQGFELGADDYLVKPFEFKELLVRIKSLIKRSRPTTANLLTFADVVMDCDMRIVKRGNRTIDLTAKEFALLHYFLNHPGKIISRAELARNIWKVDFDTGTNMVEVYVNYLRKKVDKGFDSKIIHTQFGMGYILRLESQ
jgi:DNA-binding response OmpR family regulator